MLICCASFLCTQWCNKHFSQKHGINSVKICWCSNCIWVEITFDNIAIYETCVTVPVVPPQSNVPCNRWHGYCPCHAAITLFLGLALDGKLWFNCFCPGRFNCSKMAELCQTAHRPPEWNLYQEDRMMSPRVLKISVCKSRPFRMLSSLLQRIVFVNFIAIVGAKS